MLHVFGCQTAIFVRMIRLDFACPTVHDTVAPLRDVDALAGSHTTELCTVTRVAA